MASGKTLQSTIEISGVLSPSLQAAINSAVDRLADMAEETLDSADAASRLVAEMSAQEDILKTMQKAYAGYVANGEESSEKAQELADKIRDVSGELEENRSTLKAAEKAAESLTDSQVGAADAYTKLERKINSQQDELSDLRREYANVVLEQGESSDEARQLAKRIGDLSKEVNDNKQKLTEAERVVDKWGFALEDAGEKAEKSSDGYTVMKDVIADFASDALQNAIEGFKELALEGDTALAMLEARTGKTGGKLEGFEDVMYEVYNGNYGESLGDVSEKLSTVISMTDDLDNASLAKVTKNAIALEDVFGFDVRESMRGVNSLMDQFGITSDEAFNLIVQGAQNGLNQNDDLMDVINEYAVQFKDAGYTADDMFNMLANGAETGTWSVDKLGDAMKEFNIRMSDGTANDYLEQLGVDADSVVAKFNKGGPEARAAIDTVMKAIQECDDETLQYQAGVGIFGTMWEDLGADTVASLMQTEGAIKSTNDAMEQMDTAAYDTLESKLGSLTRKYKGVGSVILGTGSAAMLTAMHWDTLTTKFATAKATLSKAGTAIATALGGITAPVWAVIAVVAVLIAAFVSLWKNNEEFRDKIIGIWEGIKGKFEAFGQAIVDRLNALGFDFESFGEVIKAIWDGFCSVLAPIFEGVFQQVSNILGGCLDVLVGLFDFFVGLFTGDWEKCWLGIKEVFVGVWDFLVATFENWGDSLKAVADTVLGWFGSSWEEVWGSTKEFFVNTWNSIASFFSGIWDSIVSFFTGDSVIAQYFQTAWENIKIVWDTAVSYFQTIWENIKLAFSAVKSVFTGDFSGAWESIKQIFANWGAFFSGLWDNVKQIFANVGGFFGSIFSGTWEKIKNIFAPAAEFFQGVWTNIKNAVQVGIMAIGEIISAAFQIITLPFRFIWENCKDTVVNIWEGIKSKVSGALDAVKSYISEKLAAAKAIVSNITGTIKNVASNAWSAVSSAASSKWESIKNAIGNKLSAAKEKVSAVTGTIKNVASNAWSAVSSAASSKWESIKNTIGNKLSAAKEKVSVVTGTIKTVASNAWSAVSSAASSKWESVKNTIGNKLNSAKATVSSILGGIKSIVSSTLGGALSKVQSIFGSIYNSISSKINAAKTAVSSAISSIKNAFNFSWSLPKIKLPHFAINGKFSLNPPSVPKFSISWYKDGGILTQPTIFGAAGNTLLAGGEAGAEAVLPLKVLWDKMETILRNVFNGASSTGAPPDDGLTATAGKLLTLDDFSLGSLSSNTSVVYYYDFSGFTWSPQIHAGGNGDDENDLMAKLKAHEAEFFDWLEEFIKMREVAQYA